MRTVNKRSAKVADYFDKSPVTNTSVLRNIVFRNCLVVGPALLIMGQGMEFERCAFDPAMFWPVDDLNRLYIGGVLMESVGFYDCRFDEIGMAAGRDVIDDFVRGFTSPPNS